jgi:hypothetical protein
MPGLARIGYSVDPTAITRRAAIASANRSALHLKVHARFADAVRVGQRDATIAQLHKRGVQAPVLLPRTWFAARRQRVFRDGRAIRCRGWCAAQQWLLDRADNFRHAACYVDQILNGVNPGDMPIRQPVKFELVIDLATPKLPSLTMSPEIMVRVTRVIQLPLARNAGNDGLQGNCEAPANGGRTAMRSRSRRTFSPGLSVVNVGSYSTRMLASRAIFRYFSISARTKRANSSGVLVRTSSPWA